MPGSANELRRALFSRVRGLSYLEIEEPNEWNVVLHVGPSVGQDPTELRQRIDTVMAYVGIAGISWSISMNTHPTTPEKPPLTGRYLLASYAANPTLDGLQESITKLVPGVAEMRVEEGPGEVRFFVADGDGAAPLELIDAVGKALEATGGLTLKYPVAALKPDDPGRRIRTRPIARDHKRLARAAEDEENQFAERVQQLVRGRVADIDLVDKFDGTKVVSTAGFGAGTPVSCFLPIYDRLYLLMPPSGPRTPDDDAEYVRASFGLSLDDFLLYCRRGKVVPVFKFPMPGYPERVARRFLDDPSLTMLRARDLDYLAARYSWQECAFLHELRNDRDLSQALFDGLIAKQDPTKPREPALEQISGMVGTMLYVAETFEGDMWRRGHLALADYSPAMFLTQMVPRLTTPEQQFALIELFGSAMHIALAQAFGASLHEALVQNERILGAAAQCFRQGAEVFIDDRAAELGQVLKALQIAYNETIPANEYIDVFDSAETKRMRALVAEVLGTGDEVARDAEIRERVQAFNAGVRKIRAKAIGGADVDVLGEIAGTGAKAATASGHGLIAEMLSFFKTGIGREVANKMFDAAIEDTPVGSALDKLRGAINRVPAQSIRLYRVRKRLGTLNDD